MYGCPWGYIYNSASTLREMQQNPRFHYLPGIVVTGVREQGDEVALSGYRANDRTPWQATGARIFLAAGVIPTTQLLLAAQSLHDRPVWIRDSQYFLFPLLALRGQPGVEHEALHTLSQLFLEVLDPRVSPHTVHLQLYTYSDLIAGGIRAALGPLGQRWLVRQLAARTMIAQGYLHSDHSGRIRMVLEKGERPQARLTAELNPETPRMVRRVLRKLLGQATRLGVVPAFPQLQLTQPGRGYHSGGTLPMSARPGELECDTLGRPFGWRRVHAVDATVLPTIPATTITYSVMANAHRIASRALD
jgi:choline dehydrogenase-like flavoprotein